jgi:prepilin-type N-terminal cleavage/methylation domain-containing protein
LVSGVFESCEVVKRSYKWQVTSDQKLCASHSGSRPSSLVTRHCPAFTLIELLVVIVILGILAGLTVPALKNISKSDANTSAARQLLDDVGHARQMAIGHHTTVYMVFVPTNFFGQLTTTNLTSTATTNLVEKQLTGYTFMADGALGDQPGDHHWHYLAPSWQNLPDGTFIAAQKFSPGVSISIPQWVSDHGTPDNWRSPLLNQIYAFTNELVPFPTENAPLVSMPCLAFDYTGRLVSEADANGNYHDAYIPLVQGSVGFGYDGATKTPVPSTVLTNAITETPPGNSGIGNNSYSYNVVHIDALTGRATLEFHKLGP